MPKLYLFGIGGTGARVIKSLTMLLASGVKAEVEFEIVPIIIDPHKDNDDVKRTISTLNQYQRIVDAAGVGNGFFATKISTLRTIENAEGLSDSYTFSLKDVESTKFKDYFSYQSLGVETQALVDILFSGKSINEGAESVDLLDVPMDIGFVGNPNIGSVVLNQFRNSEEYKIVANNFSSNDRIFIISSIFGGTGAAGFPTILKTIRDANEQKDISNAGFLRDSAIGALSVMPYFNIEASENSPINKSDFIEKTKAALSYYKDNVGSSVNTFYYLGDDCTGKSYQNDPGYGGQKNPAHLIEVVGALSIIDFLNIADRELQSTNGVPLQNIYKEYAIREDVDQLNFSHFHDFTKNTLGSSLTRFSLFKKYTEEAMASALEKQTWSTTAPLIDQSFYRGQFYSSNLQGFFKVYGEWLAELADNTRSFNPFNHVGDLHGFVVDKPVDKGFMGLKKFDFGAIDKDLNKRSRDYIQMKPEQKFLKLFFDTSKELVSAKYNY